MINEHTLCRTGRRIESAPEGLTLKIEKSAESAGALKAYIYLIMDAQLNITDGAFHSIDYQKNVDNARTLYGAACGSNWGWKDSPSLGLA